MSNFIELTLISGEKIFVNTLNIIALKHYESTIVVLSTKENIAVTEEYFIIKQMIESSIRGK